jgi:hypothetical protein
MRRALIVNCLAVVLVAVIGVVLATSSSDRPRRSLFLPMHTRVTLSGQTLGSRPGQHMKGHVFATARWNNGAPYVVAVPATDASGRWRVTFHPSHRGFYTLRILTPDAGTFEYAFVVR